MRVAPSVIPPFVCASAPTENWFNIPPNPTVIVVAANRFSISRRVILPQMLITNSSCFLFILIPFSLNSLMLSRNLLCLWQLNCYFGIALFWKIKHRSKKVAARVLKSAELSDCRAWQKRFGAAVNFPQPFLGRSSGDNNSGNLFHFLFGRRVAIDFCWFAEWGRADIRVKTPVHNLEAVRIVKSHIPL